MSRLRRAYERGIVKPAFDLLRKRTEIYIDADYKRDPFSEDLAYDLTSHYLDFMLVMGKSIGFDAIMPNTASDLLFVFNLDLHQPHRMLKTKHADLGFSLTGRVLYMGRSRGKDTVWLVMVPNTFLAAQDDGFSDDEDEDEPSRTELPSDKTNMEGKHYFMMVMFIAFVFQKYLPNRSVCCYEMYPDLSVNAFRNVKAATNLLCVHIPSQ